MAGRKEDEPIRKLDDDLRPPMRGRLEYLTFAMSCRMFKLRSSSMKQFRP